MSRTTLPFQRLLAKACVVEVPPAGHASFLVEHAIRTSSPAGPGVDRAFYVAVPEQEEALLRNAMAWTIEKLVSSGHRADERFALHAIAMAVALGPAHRGGSAGALLSLLARIESASATIAYAPAYSLPAFEIGRFKCSRFVPEEWRKRGEAAGTDFFSPATRSIEWSGRDAIVWSIPRVAVIAPTLSPSETAFVTKNDPRLRAYEQLYTRYMCRYAMTLQQQFWIAFENEQALAVAAGAYPVNPQHVRRGTTTSMAFCLFEGFRSQSGWCAPIYEDPSVYFDDALETHARRLRGRFGLPLDFQPTTRFDRVVTEYARLVTRAKLHEMDGRDDEGFLHFIIALDTAFGSARDTTRTLADRVASMLATDEASRLRWASEIKHLYNARSRYVHDGVGVPPAAFKRVAEVCATVFEALLVAREDDRFRGTDGFQRFLASLTTRQEAEPQPPTPDDS